jgi:hypothetical protein
MRTNRNEPAYPLEKNISISECFAGLTKREHFAGLAMQGLLANQTVRDILSGNNGMQVPDLIAEYSLQYADALIEELNKTER